MKRNIEFNLNIFALPLKLSVSVSFICIISRTFCRIIAINPGFLVKVVFEILFFFKMTRIMILIVYCKVLKVRFRRIKLFHFFNTKGWNSK